MVVVCHGGGGEMGRGGGGGGLGCAVERTEHGKWFGDAAHHVIGGGYLLVVIGMGMGKPVGFMWV